MDISDYLVVALAAMAAGLVNALAGGGTLISFPALMAAGVPAIASNVTNTVALVPGYLGATFAQLRDLRTQKRRVFMFLPAAVLGGAAGGLLLLNTGEELFQELVPFLILLASLLLAVQDPVKRWLNRRSAERGDAGLPEGAGVAGVGLAAVYGGYFGAGLSVIILAALGLTQNENLTRLNALKQIIAFATNVTAALFFLFSGQVVWSAALVMAVGALLGGVLGGKLAGRLKPSVLRGLVVTIGIIVAVIYFIR
jgi:uncharacterized membrane protein YfcA